MQKRFETFTVLIAKIARSIRKIKTVEMAEFNLKSPHVSCLYYLYKAGELTSKELCDLCEEDKAAISRSIDYLEDGGYVVCRSAAKKRYRAPFQLTEKGQEIGARIAEKIDTILDSAGAGMSETERETLYRCLGLISDNLQEICNQYGGEKNGDKNDH